MENSLFAKIIEIIDFSFAQTANRIECFLPNLCSFVCFSLGLFSVALVVVMVKKKKDKQIAVKVKKVFQNTKTMTTTIEIAKAVPPNCQK